VLNAIWTKLESEEYEVVAEALSTGHVRTLARPVLPLSRKGFER
jgi:hypothetical protein